MLASMYAWFHQLNGGDDFLISLRGSFVVLFFSSWLFNFSFLCVDLLQPKWAQPYKPVSFAKVLATLPLVLFNQLVITPPFLVLAHFIGQTTGISTDLELPSMVTSLYHLLFCAIVEDVLLYAFHRLLHHPRIYRHIHKLHHKWTAPIGLATLYAHPIEHVLVNVIPVLAGPVLCGAHITTAWIWYIFLVFSVIVQHSGYHFPFLPSPERHDYHHATSKENFGVFGWTDWLLGTDKTFKGTVNAKRNYYSFSLTPPRVLFSAEKKL